MAGRLLQGLSPASKCPDDALETRLQGAFPGFLQSLAVKPRRSIVLGSADKDYGSITFSL